MNMFAQFQRLLVPVDFTAKNERALDIALEAARSNSAHVTLLHVIERIENLPDEELVEFYDQLETRARSELESMAERFSQAGTQVDRTIRFGKRAEEIVREAADADVDLIVMSSHKLDPQQPARSMATLSYQVSILCRCPILLVK